MIWKYIISIFFWLIYIISGVGFIIILIIFFRIFILDPIKKRFKKFPYSEKEILEEDSFREKEK